MLGPAMIWITTALFLTLVPTVQEVPPAGPPVDLTPYLVRPNEQRDTPDGFELAFTGEASHRLRFRYGSADAVELEVSVGFPAGGARFERRLMEPGSEKAPVNFDLGPLLGHGPWRPLPADARKGPAPKPVPPIQIPTAPQLFLDDFLIENMIHLQKVLHPARRLSDEPMLRADRPWEGHAAMLGPDSYSYNQEKQRHELRYVGNLGAYRLLAVSQDGLTWTKPELGLVQFQGSRANNILKKLPPRGSLGEQGNFGGLWDYRTRGAPDLRTATLVGNPRSETMRFQQGRYLMVRDRDGVRYLTSERPFMQRHLQLETLDSPTDNLGPLFYDERTGELVLYFAAHPPAKGKFLVRYDNKWAVSRNLGRLTTHDGVNWKRSYIWSPPREHPRHQSYGMQRVERIGDLYVAFFPLYDCGTQKMNIHLWVSRNGIHWEDVGGDQAWPGSQMDLRAATITGSSTALQAGGVTETAPSVSITAPTRCTSTPGSGRRWRGPAKDPEFPPPRSSTMSSTMAGPTSRLRRPPDRAGPSTTASGAGAGAPAARAWRRPGRHSGPRWRPTRDRTDPTTSRRAGSSRSCRPKWSSALWVLRPAGLESGRESSRPISSFSRAVG